MCFVYFYILSDALRLLRNYVKYNSLEPFYRQENLIRICICTPFAVILL